MFIVGNLISEVRLGGVINFRDSSQCLCAFGVYSGRGRTTTREPWTAERKVARMVDIFSIAIGWKLLFRPLYNNRARMCVCVTHTHKRSGLGYFQYTPPSAQIESANPLTLFSSPAAYVYASPPPVSSTPFISLRDCIFLWGSVLLLPFHSAYSWLDFLDCPSSRSQYNGPSYY